MWLYTYKRRCAGHLHATRDPRSPMDRYGFNSHTHQARRHRGIDLSGEMSGWIQTWDVCQIASIYGYDGDDFRDDLIHWTYTHGVRASTNSTSLSHTRIQLPPPLGRRRSSSLRLLHDSRVRYSRIGQCTAKRSSPYMDHRSNISSTSLRHRG